MDLFSTKNRASTRKGHPESSRIAENRLNERDGVTKQEQEVLASLSKYGPCTAKELGILMARDSYIKAQGTGMYVSKEYIREIIRIAGQPHRRLKALLDDGKVTMTEHSGGNRYEVNE
jgi:hypothetical protein